jgi:hypothetical protein
MSTYRRAVTHLIGDSGTDSAGLSYLLRLQGLLNLGTAEAQVMFDAAADSAFRRASDQFMDRVSPNRASAASLCRSFASDEADARAKESRLVADWAKLISKRVRLSGRLTLSDYLALKADVLAMEVDHADALNEDLRIAFVCWNIESGAEMLPVNADINLPADEQCFASAFGRWVDGKKNDVGTVYLTRSRVVFNGKERAFTLRYSNILGVHQQPDPPLHADATWVQLRKATATSPVFWSIRSGCDLFYVAITRLMREAAGPSRPAKLATRSRLPIEPMASPLLDSVISEYEGRKD